MSFSIDSITVFTVRWRYNDDGTWTLLEPTELNGVPGEQIFLPPTNGNYYPGDTVTTGFTFGAA
jgi:hypothetical protein